MLTDSQWDTIEAALRNCPGVLSHRQETLATLRQQLDEANAELTERDKSFELRNKADMRAIAKWQEATGKELMWPDHADMCVWLMGQLAAKDAEIAALRSELAEVKTRLSGTEAAWDEVEELMFGEEGDDE